MSILHYNRFRSEFSGNHTYIISTIRITLDENLRFRSGLSILDFLHPNALLTQSLPEGAFALTRASDELHQVSLCPL